MEYKSVKFETCVCEKYKMGLNELHFVVNIILITSNANLQSLTDFKRKKNFEILYNIPIKIFKE